MNELILPGDQLFEETLANPGEFWFRQGQRDLSGDFVFIQPADQGGLLIPVSAKEADVYFWGGEYDEAVTQFDGEPDDDSNQWLWD